MNRSVLKFINSAFFSTYKKNYYFQEFNYSPEFEMLLFARISIHYDDDVFSFYFYPNGAILNDLKDESLIHVGITLDEMIDYYSTTELDKLSKKNPLKKFPLLAESKPRARSSLILTLLSAHPKLPGKTRPSS